MVAQITKGHALDHDGRPFRRRRLLPAAIVLTIVIFLSAAVWLVALTRSTEKTTTASCNTSGTELTTALGQKVSESELVDQIPASLSQTKVRVYNANGKQGQAGRVSEQLSNYGFSPAPEPRYADDPIYRNQDLQCRGQIRFGASGKAAAAALWIAFPCGELIEDKRQDDTVDLALGKLFSELAPSSDSENALKALKNSNTGSTNPVSTELLTAVHSETC